MSGMQDVFEALASPVRREILWLVRDREVAAGELSRACELSPATMSQHLTVLRRAGLVQQRAEGNFRLYRANVERLRRLHSVLAADDGRWLQTHPHPEARHTTVRQNHVVSVAVHIPSPRHQVFGAFVDPETYSRWLGGPVSLVEGRFIASFGEGLQVRGRYEQVIEPSLIVMAWDFGDREIPLPGDELAAYAHFRDAPAGGCDVEVHQLVKSAEQIPRLTSAWTMVLGRLYEFFVPGL